MIRHPLLLVIAATALLSMVAIANNQPFFFQDTSAYIRAPDFAITKILGDRFATEWHQSARPDVEEPSPDSPHVAGKHRFVSTGLSSVREEAVLAGRSPYYGAVLYASHLAGRLWPAVFLQAFVAAALTFMTTSIFFGRQRIPFLVVISSLFALTSLPFFVGFLMPDVWAGLAALAFALYVMFGSSLTRPGKFFLYAVMIFASISHTTIMLLLICLFTAFSVITAIDKGTNIGSLRGPSILTASIILISIFANIGFGAAVEKIVGKPAIMPPFITARVIEDGPGQLYAEATCPDSGYRVCDFVNRFPVDSQDFLWSADPQVGVFAVVDADTRRELSEEQFEFALNSVLAHPILQLRKSFSNWWQQLFKLQLADFQYTEQERITYAQKLPPSYGARLEKTFAYRELWPIPLLTGLHLVAATVSGLYIILSLAVHVFGSKRNITRNDQGVNDRGYQAVIFATIILLAVIINAAICGMLSEPVPRYQARIAWLLPFAALILAMSVRTTGVARVRSRPSDFERF
jgi:hypothetical protein